MNLFHPIEKHAQKAPEKTAIVYDDRRITYGEFISSVDQLAEIFSNLGLQKGERIALLMHNSPEMIFAFYGAMKLGLIDVSLNIMFKKDELDFIVEDAGPKVLIVHEQYRAKAETLRQVAEGRLKILVLDDSLVAAAGGPRELTAPDLRPEDEAVIGYTSGTTGFPKGALHTHENLLFHLEEMRTHLGFNETDVFLAALPFFQLTAFLIHPAMAFHSGATLVIMEKFETAQFLKLVKQEGVTFFAGVPTIYKMLFDASGGGRSDLNGVRFGICAGAPLSSRLQDDFETKMNFRIIHAYGSTETPLIAAFENPYSPSKGISVGKPSPYLRVRLVKEDGTTAGVDEEGEIQICAEKALKCYWNNPKATREAIRDGWFFTGDIGKMDSDGYLKIVDRAKDMIIRGGFNVYPAEIERMLLQEPRIKQAVVVGEPHERLGEIPKAYIIPEEGAEITEEEIIALSREKMASFKAVEKVEFVSQDFFPTNALGKVIKSRLRNISGG